MVKEEWVDKFNLGSKVLYFIPLLFSYNMRLDSNEKMPSGMKDYLNFYGWHFNKKLCDFAVKHMTISDGAKVEAITKESIEQMLDRYGIVLEKCKGYDAVFVANMAKADYYGSSIPSEDYLVRFIKDYIDDPDGYDGLPMTRYFADVIGKGVVIDWEDML